MSLLEPIMNGVVAVTNAVGLTEPASAETKAARLATCNACIVTKGATCGVCGCVLSAKAALQNEKCPLNKWEV
jgi:hypothetical protein